MAELTENTENTGRNPDGTFAKGNPGRPPGSVSIVSAIKRKLEDVDPVTKKKYLDLVIETIFENGLEKKDVKTLTDLIDRVDGKPRQNLGLDGGEDGKEILVSIVKYADNAST